MGKPRVADEISDELAEQFNAKLRLEGKTFYLHIIKMTHKAWAEWLTDRLEEIKTSSNESEINSLIQEIGDIIEPGRIVV